MNWKRGIGLSIMLVAGVYLLHRPIGPVPSLVVTENKITRAPASLPTPVTPVPADLDPFHELKNSRLSAEKIQAILDLNAFHQSHPTFNQENILRRAEMLEVLMKDPSETVERFSELMRTSKDDGLKSFLLNLTMSSAMSDEEKASIFLARLKVKTKISQQGLVADDQLSLMIGLSHLVRLEDDEAKAVAMTELKLDQALMADAGFRTLLRDYDLLK